MKQNENITPEQGHSANMLLYAVAPTAKLSTDSKAFDSGSDKRGLTVGAPMNYIVVYHDDKISIETDEATSNKLRTALMLSSDFWIDIQRNFNKFPIVQTTIICKGKANPKIFELKSVRDCFKQNDTIRFFNGNFEERISNLDDGFLSEKCMYCREPISDGGWEGCCPDCYRKNVR